jgi:hypothetical protein
MVSGALGIAVVLTLALVFAILHRGPDQPAAAAPPVKTWPIKWDKKIAPYARIAARERGLEFVHPVPVRFLSPEKFAKTVTKDKDELTQDDRSEIRNTTGLLRALGLVHGKVDLVKQQNALNSGGILAYYSYRDQQITVRGHKIGPAVGSTLVHELTHVLQDQHFHVGDRLKKLRHDRKDTASSVLQAIVEGDAVRVQGLYRTSLKPHQRAVLDAASKKETQDSQQRIRGVPQVLVTMMASPYTLGQGLVETAAAYGGNRAVDRLFDDPPVHENVLLDPYRAIAHQTDARRVVRPRLTDGEKKLDSGELGALTWYFMLGERVPIDDALAAADGWGDDSYVAYTQDGTSCMRASYVGRTPGATRDMLTQLRRWVADGSAKTASVKRHGRRLEFQSCDPGSAVSSGADTTKVALTLVATRAGLAAGLGRRGVPAAAARCVAARMIDTWTVAELSSATFIRDDPANQSRLQQLVLACGRG